MEWSSQMDLKRMNLIFYVNHYLSYSVLSVVTFSFRIDSDIFDLNVDQVLISELALIQAQGTRLRTAN